MRDALRTDTTCPARPIVAAITTAVRRNENGWRRTTPTREGSADLCAAAERGADVIARTVRTSLGPVGWPVLKEIDVMRQFVCCAFLVLGSACGLGESSASHSGSLESCQGSDAGPCPAGDAAPTPDAPGGSTLPGEFPDPNGAPPPLETTCDCIDSDADAICDDLDSCFGNGATDSDGDGICDGDEPSGPSRGPLVLITGFGPFDGYPVNPSGEVINQNALQPLVASLMSSTSVQFTYQVLAVDSSQPNIITTVPGFPSQFQTIISLGVTSGPDIRIETSACNCFTGTDGDACLDCTEGNLQASPVPNLPAQLNGFNVVSGTSTSCGTFLCNATLRNIAMQVQNGALVGGVFIHVPNVSADQVPALAGAVASIVEAVVGQSCCLSAVGDSAYCQAMGAGGLQYCPGAQSYARPRAADMGSIGISALSAFAEAGISGWGCEYSRPTCTATTEPACRAVQDCEWAITPPATTSSCREKACVNSWRQLCQAFVARAAAGDRWAYRGGASWASDLFTTGPEPVPAQYQWGDVGGSLSYTWEGHSGVTWVNSFLTFVTEVVNNRVPTATTYNLTNNGCGTFNVTNFQTITNYLKTTLYPILRARDPRQTAVVCGQQNVCGSNDSTAYRACGDGQCAGARGNDFSRICFSIDGNADPASVSYNVFNECRIGSTCTDWPGNNLSWCKSGGQWACQQCTQEGPRGSFVRRLASPARWRGSVPATPPRVCRLDRGESTQRLMPKSPS